MRNRINIYCDSAFWMDYFDDELVALRDRNRCKAWVCFFDFLRNNNVFINLAKTDVDENTCGGRAIDELLRATGGAGIHFIPGRFPMIESLGNGNDDNLNSIFLTTKPESECEEMSQRLGVLVMNKEMVYRASHLFEDCGKVFQKKIMPNWEYLYDYSKSIPSINYCNSLIIVDRYLFSKQNHSNVHDNNLKPIFNALLPKQLCDGIVFNIIIFSNISNPDFYDGSDDIKGIIDEIRPNLNYSLKVIDNRKLHDRVIITNNIMLSCGAGFDVIGNDGYPIKFTTTSLSFPFLIGQESSRTAYLSWIHTVLNECRRNFGSFDVTTHRLLNHYYEPPRSKSYFIRR